MPKKKKTRKQKAIADMRHIEYKHLHKPLEEKSSLPPTAFKPQQNVKQAIAVADFRYLYSDLTKTIILTSSIIIAELVIKHFFGAQ